MVDFLTVAVAIVTMPPIVVDVVRVQILVRPLLTTMLGIMSVTVMMRMGVRHWSYPKSC